MYPAIHLLFFFIGVGSSLPTKILQWVYYEIDFYFGRRFDRNNVYSCFPDVARYDIYVCFYKVDTRTTTEKVSFSQSSSNNSYAYLKFMSEGLDGTIFLVPILAVCYSCYPVDFATKMWAICVPPT